MGSCRLLASRSWNPWCQCPKQPKPRRGNRFEGNRTHLQRVLGTEALDILLMYIRLQPVLNRMSNRSTFWHHWQIVKKWDFEAMTFGPRCQEDAPPSWELPQSITSALLSKLSMFFWFPCFPTIFIAWYLLELFLLVVLNSERTRWLHCIFQKQRSPGSQRFGLVDFSKDATHDCTEAAERCDSFSRSKRRSWGVSYEMIDLW